MQGACTIQPGVRRETGEEAFETVMVAGPPGAEPGEIERQCLEGG